MSLTVKGGNSFRNVAAMRGRELIRQRDELEKTLRRLREKKNPSLKIGPLLKAKRT